MNYYCTHPELRERIERYMSDSKRKEPYRSIVICLCILGVLASFISAYLGAVLLLFSVELFVGHFYFSKKRARQMVRDFFEVVTLEEKEVLVFDGDKKCLKKADYFDIVEMELIDIYTPTHLPNGASFMSKEICSFICLHVGYSIMIPHESLSTDYRKVPNVILFPYTESAWRLLESKLNGTNAHIAVRST